MPPPVSPYPLFVRLAHASSAVAIFLLVGSGLAIFNAHPVLYAADASDPARAVLRLPDGVPAGLTLGGWLAGGRRLHFAAAWVLLGVGAGYLGFMLASARRRVVWPTRADLRALPGAVRGHLRWPPELAGPDGGPNPLQKLAYLLVPVGLGGGVVATGLALSPAWDAVVPGWTDLLGGRQMARTLHFAAMAGFVAFTALHVALVAIAGTWRRMVTGHG